MYYMIYTSKITIKGTTTIPADLRKKLGLKPGSEIRFEENPKTKSITIEPVPSIEEIRVMNKTAMIKAGTWPPKPFKSGDGFRWHVKQKYGKARKS